MHVSNRFHCYRTTRERCLSERATATIGHIVAAIPYTTTGRGVPYFFPTRSIQFPILVCVFWEGKWRSG